VDATRFDDLSKTLLSQQSNGSLSIFHGLQSVFRNSPSVFRNSPSVYRGPHTLLGRTRCRFIVGGVHDVSDGFQQNQQKKTNMLS
jgi:hypothetical protein